MTDFARVLNPEQCEAATAPDGPMLVLAAAGTGKTRTLVHRVAYLVEKGVPPERMLLVTFTNRAAKEMLERAGRLVPEAAGIWNGTFHHVCARFLRRHAVLPGYGPGFGILDAEDQKKLMGECIKDFVKTPKDFPKKEVLLKMVSDAKNREIPLEKTVASFQTKIAFELEEALNVVRAYEERKRGLGAMDFDDLLVNALKLVEEHDDVRELLQEHFMHVLVDEYQDTNSLQARLTDILAAKSRNIMVVGDDFQCIYTWRGAQFDNIMEFPDRWPGCRIVKLERNYRSLPPILDVANTVMKDARHAFAKTLKPFRNGEAAPKPRLYTMYDGYTQAETLVKLVDGLRSQGVPLHDIAILYRSHFASIDVQMAFTRRRIPFRITSGVGVFEQLHVKDVLAFLRMCLDSGAEMSFVRLLSLLPGVAEAGARKLWRKAGGVFDGNDGAQRMDLEAMLPARSRVAWEGVSKAFAGARAHLDAGEGGKIVQDFVQYFYGDHLRLQFGEEDATGRLEDLGEITAQIAAFGGGLEGFLNEVSLMTNLDARARENLPADHLLLSTVHQAKGMEWPVVILPWLVDGIFPNSRALDDGNLDEERRLFYVAVTRAKDRLYLSVPKTRRTADGVMFPSEASMFVREIPPELVESQEIRAYSPEMAYGGSRGGNRWGARPAHGGGRPQWKTTWRR